MTFLWYNSINERKEDKKLERHQDCERMPCIWECLNCEYCDYYYYEDMEYDDTNRRSEFMKDWFEYIEDRGE